MNINVYKLSDKFTKYTVRTELKELNYDKVGKDVILSTSSMRIVAFSQQSYNDQFDWRELLDNFFDIEEPNTLFKPKQVLRVILVASYYNATYLISYGLGYIDAQSLADLHFPNDFIIKVSDPTELLSKTVQFIHSARGNSVTNYLTANADIAEANEAYQAIKVRPRNPKIFGKQISANFAVTFSPNFSHASGYLGLLNNLIWNVNYYETLERGSSYFPRAKRIKDKKNKNILNHKLLQKMMKNDSSVNLLFSFNDGLRNLEIPEGTKVVAVINGNYKLNKEISFTLSDIIKWIGSLSDVNFSRIKIVVQTEDGDTYPIPILKLLSVEFKGLNQNVLLDRGQWAILNEKYIENIDRELRVRQDELVFQHDSEVLAVRNHGSRNNESLEEQLMNGFVLSATKQYQKIHTKLIYSKRSAGTKIELGDLFDKENEEMVAVKRVEKSSTSDMVYSLEQSINSMAAIRHLDEYRPAKFLNFSEVSNVRNVTVFWLFDSNDRKKDAESIKSSNWELTSNNSIILNAKIIEWYKYAINNGFKPKIMVGYYKR